MKQPKQSLITQKVKVYVIKWIWNNSEGGKYYKANWMKEKRLKIKLLKELPFYNDN